MGYVNNIISINEELVFDQAILGA